MAPTAMLINDEERVAAEVLIKKGVVLEKAAFEGDGTRAQGLTWNYHKDGKNLVFHEKYEWSEHSVSSYLDVIYPSKFGQPQIFTHQAPLPVGSKAGLVYADGDDSTARKWLVAFDSVNNKVYVEAGPKTPTNWNEVEEKLNASGSVSEFEDPIFHGKASAEIRRETNISLLFVRFTN